ncbi:MAG: hypothetical protein ACXV2J_13490 [Actinomycetes bacterium]
MIGYFLSTLLGVAIVVVPTRLLMRAGDRLHQRIVYGPRPTATPERALSIAADWCPTCGEPGWHDPTCPRGRRTARGAA